MPDPDDPPPPATPRKTGRKPDRAERLAEELRANLRRRKDQARRRTGPGECELPAASGDLDVEPPDQSGH